MLLTRYQTVRRTTEALIKPLAIEDCVVQTSTECSPVKWHLAHTTWFFEAFILIPHAGPTNGLLHRTYRPFHPTYGYLFNSYYNAIGDRTPRPSRGMMSRPTLAEVMEYRAFVDAAMEGLLARLEEQDAEHSKSTAIIELGLNHEQQHQELLLTDVKTVLAMNPLRPVYCPSRARLVRATPTSLTRGPIVRGEQSHIPNFTPRTNRAASWIAFDEGLVEIGHDAGARLVRAGTGFFFDNEGPRHQVFLQRFEIANRLVTNREFKDFIADGGYTTPTLWLSDGWTKRIEENWTAPKYWEEKDGEWWNMTLSGFRPVNDAEPVTHISHYEADAFATWCRMTHHPGARLPTEFEWEAAAGEPRAADQSRSANDNFLDNGHYHPIPETQETTSSADDGSSAPQLFGNVWQWTRSAYLPYPSYKPAPGAIGEYNGKFMSNQMVLRGGSCMTPRDHIRATYRNFFPPEARWQFSGIRLAK